MDTRLSKNWLLRVAIVCLLATTGCRQVSPDPVPTETTQESCADSDVQAYIGELQSFRPLYGDFDFIENENYDGSVDTEVYKKLVACGESAVPQLIEELTLNGMIALHMESYNALILSILTEIGSDAVPKLVEIIQNSEFSNAAATVALGSIASKASSEVSDVIPILVQDLRDYGAEQYALGEMGSAAVPALIQLLQSDVLEERSRSAVVSLLGNIGPSASEATPLLLEILETSPNEEIFTALALSKIGTASSTVVPLILEAIEATKLMDSSSDRFLIETEVLSHYGGLAKDAAPVLGNLMKAEAESEFPDFLTLCYATTALGKMGQAGEAQLEDLYRNHQDIHIKVLAAYGLINFRQEIPDLLLEEENLQIWASMQEVECFDPSSPALTFSDSATPALIKISKSENEKLQVFGIYGLGNIDAPSREVVSELIQKLQSNNSTVRLAAVEALGTLGELAREASDEIFATLQDSDKEVREAASIALFQVNQTNPATSLNILAFDTGASGRKVSGVISRTWSRR